MKIFNKVVIQKTLLMFPLVILPLTSFAELIPKIAHDEVETSSNESFPSIANTNNF